MAETAAEDGGVNKRHVLALFRNYPHLSVANTLFYRYLGILMPRRSNAAFQYRCKRGFIFITHRPLGLALHYIGLVKRPIKRALACG
eukprot:COSAG03_NODE_862_length_5589_cov_1348.742805_3_plen_87_part_00